MFGDTGPDLLGDTGADLFGEGGNVRLNFFTGVEAEAAQGEVEGEVDEEEAKEMEATKSEDEGGNNDVLGDVHEFSEEQDKDKGTGAEGKKEEEEDDDDDEEDDAGDTGKEEERGLRGGGGTFLSGDAGRSLLGLARLTNTPLSASLA